MLEPQSQEIEIHKPLDFINNLNLDSEHHLLSSPSWQNPGNDCRFVMIGTGSPEKAGYVAGEATMEKVFELDQPGKLPKVAIAQLYVGDGLKDQNPESIAKNLEYALAHLPQSAKVDLILYSYSTLSLSSLSADHLKHIRSLTLISPMMGNILRTDVDLKQDIFHFILQHLIHLPDSHKYLDSIKVLFEKIKELDIPVSFYTGKTDTNVDNKIIVQHAVSLGYENTLEMVKQQDRSHAITPQQLVDIIQHHLTAE